MKKYILLLSTVILLIFVTGCNKDTCDCPSDNESVLTSEIDGNWKLSDGSTLDILVRNRTIYFTSTYNSVYTEERAKFQFTGTKTIQPNDLVVKKIHNISIDQYTKPLTQQKTDEWNGTGYCGYVDWKVNTQKDVSGCLNSTISDKGIYDLNSTTIRWGGGSFDTDSEGYSNSLAPYPAGAWYRI